MTSSRFESNFIRSYEYDLRYGKRKKRRILGFTVGLAYFIKKIRMTTPISSEAQKIMDGNTYK